MIKFAKEGASVVIHGQNPEKLEEVHCTIASSGVPESKLLVVSGAIQDDKVQDKLINETIKKFGRLDVLVNNAGVSMKSGADGNSLESFDLVFAINVRAVYRLIQLATPHLEKTKGSIVNISSGLSEKTYPRAMPYSISKAAINHLTRNFASVLASKGIRVNALAPGLVITEFVTRHGVPKEQSDAVYDDYAKRVVPLERSSQPEEQADVILYLASPTTSYMTASIVFNDGGILVSNPK